MKRPWFMRRLFWALCAAALCGCSLIVDHFSECNRASDCGAGKLCVQNYCVTTNCFAVYGSGAGNSLAFAALMPLTEATKPDAGTDQAQLADLDAALLAFNQLAATPVGGQTTSLYACDTGNDPAVLTNELQELVQAHHLVAAIVSHSSQVLAVAPPAVQDNVLVMSPTATSPSITSLSANAPGPGGQNVRMVWRTAPSDTLQAQLIVTLLTHPTRYALPGLATYLSGINKVAILWNQNDPYGQGFEAQLNAGLTAAGFTSATLLLAPFQASNPTSGLAVVNSFAPDLTIAAALPNDLLPILDAAAKLPNLSASGGHKWFFTDAAEDRNILADPVAAAQMLGAYGTAPSEGSGGSFSAFSQTYTATYGFNPTSESFTAHSYDAMYLLELAAAWAAGPGPAYTPVTGPGIAEGLCRVSNPAVTPTPASPSQFEAQVSQLLSTGSTHVLGASGDLQFDCATGEAPSGYDVWTATGGSFQVVGTIAPTDGGF
jgi:branched-chain amino acid transport system substrate-binding protein